MNRLFIISLIAFALVSCHSKKAIDFESVMTEADNLMESCQDSALISLSMLDGIRPDVSEMSKKDRMRFYLLEAKAMNKGFIDFTSDSTMLEVVDYYKSHGSNKDKLEANYLLGSIYRDLKDAPKAISYFYQATKFAGDDQFSYLMLSRIYGQIAVLYDTQGLFGEAISKFELASDYAWLAGDTINAINDINLKATAYSTLGKNDSAVMNKEKVIKMYKDLGYIKYAAQISSTCVESYLYLGEFERAKETMSLYEQHSGYYKNGVIARGHEPYYYLKGLLHLYSNQLDSAKILFTKCAEFMEDPNMKIMHYRGLSLLYDKLQKPDSTAKYAMLAYDANDSAYQINAAQVLLNLESLYNYGKYQEESIALYEERLILQRWLFGTILIIISAVISFLYIFRLLRKRNDRKIAQIHERYETERKLLQNEMEELNALLEEKESLQENIMLQRQKEMQVEIGQKEQSINELLTRVNEYEKFLKVKDTVEMEDDIQSSQIKSDFAYFVTHVTEHPTETQWNHLTKYAKRNLPQLYLLLHKYNVSQKEMRLCILIRLRFKPGEIATILDCGFPEVSLMRSRLLKKIYGIENGKTSDFDRRLMLLY